jgi:hypothetical protein
MSQNNDENQNKDNKLFALMDIINSENENNVKEKLNIPDYSMNSNSKDIPETLDEEEESRQSLNPEHKELLDITDSGIIQIPNKYVEGQSQISSDDNNINSTENEFSSPLNSNKNTLDEPISTTLLRDISLIYYKLKHVINPFSSNFNRQKHIREWDLWGPLLFITLLSCTLAIKSKDKSNIVVIIFSIFWLGSLLVYLNATLLDSKIKFFPVLCLLGYCLFPLNISAFILSISNFYEFIRFLLVLLTCAWALISVEGYFRSVSSPEQKWLVFYPAILMFAFIAWFVFTTK